MEEAEFKIEHDPTQPKPYSVYKKQNEGWAHLGGSVSRQAADNFIASYVDKEEVTYFDKAGKAITIQQAAS